MRGNPLEKYNWNLRKMMTVTISSTLGILEKADAWAQTEISLVLSIIYVGRGGGIRTPDPLLPKQMRYQTALRPDMPNSGQFLSVPRPQARWVGSLYDCNPSRILFAPWSRFVDG